MSMKRRIQIYRVLRLPPSFTVSVDNEFKCCVEWFIKYVRGVY